MDKSTFIHDTALVDPGAQIGKGTKVWHFTHIMPKAQIGENCIIGQNVFVANNVSIGNGTKIQNNVSVYEGVVCENDVFIGPSVVFTNIINPRSFIERKSEFKKTLVKNGASIGANTTILCGNTIGSYALIGAGTVVLRNIKDFELVVGNPARHIGWVARDGSKLEFKNNICIKDGLEYQLSSEGVTINNNR